MEEIIMFIVTVDELEPREVFVYCKMSEFLSHQLLSLKNIIWRRKVFMSNLQSLQKIVTDKTAH